MPANRSILLHPKAQFKRALTLLLVFTSCHSSCYVEKTSEHNSLDGFWRSTPCPNEVLDMNAPFSFKGQTLEQGRIFGQSYNGIEYALKNSATGKYSNFVVKRFSLSKNEFPFWAAQDDIALSENFSGFFPKIVKIDFDNLSSPTELRIVKQRTPGQRLADIMTDEFEIHKIQRRLKKDKHKNNPRLTKQLDTLETQSLLRKMDVDDLYTELLHLKATLALSMEKAAKKGLFLIDVNPNSLRFDGNRWRLAYARALPTRVAFANELQEYLEATLMGKKMSQKYKDLIAKIRSTSPLNSSDFEMSLSLQIFEEEYRLKKIIEGS